MHCRRTHRGARVQVFGGTASGEEEMTSSRFDMYSLVHKGQRRKLFELTGRAGQLAADDAATRAALVADLEETLAAITEHARAEEAHFGPIYAEVAPETGRRLAADHGDLERELGALRAFVAESTRASSQAADLALHRALARFTASYLVHIDAEEASMPELWGHVDDARLARTQAALVASHPRATVRFNLVNMLPAASSAERVGFLSGLRRNMPPPAFAAVREMIDALVTPAEWARIEASGASAEAAR
jgi:hypothetical protein